VPESREMHARRLARRAAGEPEITPWPAWVFVLLFAVLLAPFWFVRLLHLITNAPDRSGRISGIWVGRVVFHQGSTGRWDMPPEGTGTWVVEVHSSIRLLTAEDSVAGTVRVCTDQGATGKAQFDSGRLVNGVAFLDVSQDASSSTLSLDNASISPRGDKLFYSGTANHGELHGILHRGTPGEFDRMCK
jgi:hypothetical protein